MVSLTTVDCYGEALESSYCLIPLLVWERGAKETAWPMESPISGSSDQPGTPWWANGIVFCWDSSFCWHWTGSRRTRCSPCYPTGRCPSWPHVRHQLDLDCSLLIFPLLLLNGLACSWSRNRKARGSWVGFGDLWVSSRKCPSHDRVSAWQCLSQLSPHSRPKSIWWRKPALPVRSCRGRWL